jgi:hypothetical protein
MITQNSQKESSIAGGILKMTNGSSTNLLTASARALYRFRERRLEKIYGKDLFRIWDLLAVGL